MYGDPSGSSIFIAHGRVAIAMAVRAGSPGRVDRAGLNTQRIAQEAAQDNMALFC